MILYYYDIKMSLQKIEIDIVTVVNLYNSLEKFVEDSRNIEIFIYHRTEGEKLSRSLSFKTKRIIHRK